MSKIQIYVITHKEVNIKLKNHYVLLQVGSVLYPSLGYLRDDVGENISWKNKNFCELTGLYWIWKNSSADIIGLVHYRRFFYAGRVNALMNHRLSSSQIERYLVKYDLIVPKITKYSRSVREIYKEKHHIEDWNLTREIIGELYPEYLETFDRVGESNELYVCNMFCGKRKILQAYCKWLFDILFELETRIDISDYDNYNQRIYGFLSERLFTVWVRWNRVPCKEVFIYNTEEESILQQALIHPIKKRIACLVERY